MNFKANTNLLPLFFLYVLVIFLRSSGSLEGDEGRYVAFAQNLSEGHYSPLDGAYLPAGPGYPLVLLPFAFLKWPWLVAKFLNGLFLFLAILFFFHTLSFYLKEKQAFLFSYFLGLYPLFLKNIHQLYTETFVVFLISGFMFYFCRAFRGQRKAGISFWLSAAFLGYLALTKVFFGYVLLAGFSFFLIFYLVKKTEDLKRSFLVYLIALLFCVPYLLYTYSLTGKIFYWGHYGGSSLYWMSTPFEGELGDWRGNGPWHLQQTGSESLIKNHGKFFEEILKLNYTEWDERLKAKALENISQHPSKFTENWLCNLGRLFFNFPYSETSQRLSTLLYVFTNMFVVVPSFLCVYPTYVGRKHYPPELFYLLFFACVSLLGSSLLSAYERHFRILVPILSLWIFFTLTRVVRIEVHS